MQELAEFDFELRHIPGKRHIPADFLSRPFGVNQGKGDNKDTVLLPAARFAQIQFPEELEQRREILRLYHDHPLAGHPGISNTTHLLGQTYEGKGMKEFAEDYVRGCYDTARGLQICFLFSLHVSPFPPHVACRPRA